MKGESSNLFGLAISSIDIMNDDYNDIDTAEMINDILEVVAEIWPEAYQKTKEAKLRAGLTKILRDYLE